MKKMTLLATLLISVAAMAQTDMKVFGIDLGKPLALPECEFTKAYKNAYVYSFKDTEICFQHQPAHLEDVWQLTAPVSTPAVNETVKITFPLNNQPSIGVGDLQATIINGNLEGISMETGGPSLADYDLETLVKKYGEPTVLQRGTASNLMGATLPTVMAIWDSPRLVVTFNSVTPDNITVGSLVIETPASALIHAVKSKTQKL